MTILFYAPQMHSLASRIQTETALKRTDGQYVELGKVSWERFNDGTPDLHIMDPKAVRGQDVAFLACFNDPAHHDESGLFEQLAVIYALPRHHARSMHVILPYFPFGTMERVDHPGRIATAMTAARLLGAIPPCHGGGPARITTYDIHALPEQFFFPDSVTVDLQSAIPLIKEELLKTNVRAIAFPDEGAAKRFGGDWGERYSVITCGKRRDGDKRIVTITDGDPRGKQVLIVDDLIQTGGTLIECRNALIKQGAKDVSVFATHGVMPQNAFENLTSGFENVWISDSCPAAVQKVRGWDPFRTLSLAPLISKNLFL